MSCCSSNSGRGGNIESGRISQVVSQSIAAVAGQEACCIPKTSGQGGNTAGASLVSKCIVRNAIVSDTNAVIMAARMAASSTSVPRMPGVALTESTRTKAIAEATSQAAVEAERLIEFYPTFPAPCPPPPPEFNNVGLPYPRPRFPCAPNLIGIL